MLLSRRGPVRRAARLAVRGQALPQLQLAHGLGVLALPRVGAHVLGDEVGRDGDGDGDPEPTRPVYRTKTLFGRDVSMEATRLDARRGVSPTRPPATGCRA